MLGEANLEKVRALNEMAAGRGQSLAQMAIAWALRDGRVTSALIGASSVAQLDDSLDALANLDFSPTSSTRSTATPPRAGSTCGHSRAQGDVGDPVVLGLDVGTTSAKAVAFDADGREHGAGDHAYPLREPEPGRAVQDPAGSSSGAAARARRRPPRARRAPTSAASRSAPRCTALVRARRRRPAAHRPADLGRHAGRRRGGAAAPRAPRPARPHGDPAAPDGAPGQAALVRASTTRDVVARARAGAASRSSSCSGSPGAWASTFGRLGHRAARPAHAATGTPRRSRSPGSRRAARRSSCHDRRLALRRPRATGLPAGCRSSPGPATARWPMSAWARCAPASRRARSARAARCGSCVERAGHRSARAAFCYALVPGLWVVGGAINNGGSVLRWLATRWPRPRARTPWTGCSTRPPRCRRAATALLMLPALLSERAPHWSVLPRGAYVGLRARTAAGHLGARRSRASACSSRSSWPRCATRATRSARSGRRAASPAARCGGRSSRTRSACRSASRPATRARPSARRCSGWTRSASSTASSARPSSCRSRPSSSPTRRAAAVYARLRPAFAGAPRGARPGVRGAPRRPRRAAGVLSRAHGRCGSARPSRRWDSRPSPCSRAAAAAPAKSVGASGGRPTSTSRSVAMSRKVRSSSPWSRRVWATFGRSPDVTRAVASSPSRSPCSRSRSRGRLLADALGARQAVGRVAAQSDEVRHLGRVDRRSARRTSSGPMSSGPSCRRAGRAPGRGPRRTGTCRGRR